MKRILLRSPKDPFEVISPRATLDRNVIGDNAGNLVFIEASHRILATAGTTISADHFRVGPRSADMINERFDAYVIPLANAFRISFEASLIQMTRLIERLTIPVVILGVGAQSNLSYDLGRLARIESSVRAFVRAVLDRAPSIGVRGELTASYLESLGFREVEVIGCPSMFLHGDKLRVEKRLERLDRDARVALTISPYAGQMGPIVEHHAEHYPNLTYIAQDADTLQRLLWGEAPRMARETSQIPIHTSHRLYRENRVRLYVDPWPWIDDLRAYDFAFGTRIHGTIAALLAGTPALVLAHDSRTLELARYFGIPHRTLSTVGQDVDAADLYAAADFSALNDGHGARFAAFTDYLRRHDLQHVFQPGEDPTIFERRVAATPYPPAVDTRATVRRPSSLNARWQRGWYALRKQARKPSARRARAAVLRRLGRWASPGST